MSSGLVVDVHAPAPGGSPADAAGAPPSTARGERSSVHVDHDARVVPVSARQGDPGVTPPR